MSYGRVTGLFVPGCRRNYVKGMKIEKNKAFWTIVKNVTFLARFVDYDLQNQNFTVSKMVISIMPVFWHFWVKGLINI